MVAYLALHLTILKKGNAEIFPYFDDIKPAQIIRMGGTPQTLIYTVPFMIKNSGARAVALSSISWANDSINMPNLKIEFNKWLSGAIPGYLILEPYEQKLHTMSVTFTVLDCSQRGLDVLLNQFEDGLVRIRLSYRAYENKKIREATEVYDLTHLVKEMILKKIINKEITSC